MAKVLKTQTFALFPKVAKVRPAKMVLLVDLNILEQPKLPSPQKDGETSPGP